jgi:tripartite-type tricarboxylate transporter receptor subunit TctC
MRATTPQAVRLVLGFSPGSFSDRIAGLIRGPLARALGRDLAVELRPGHNGSHAARDVAGADPDGKTLFMATLGTHAIAPNRASRPPYDPLQDFACVCLVAKSPMLLACNTRLGIGSTAELIERAGDENFPLSYATSAVGGAPHLAAELFQEMTGITLQHVRYDETERLYSDLEAGAVALSFNNLISMLPRCRRGALRALAVSSARRMAAAPDIPTIAEAGVPGYEVTNWVGIVAPRATDPALVAELSNAVNAALESDAVTSALLADGVTPCGGAPEVFASFMAAELKRWQRIAARL